MPLLKSASSCFLRFSHHFFAYCKQTTNLAITFVSVLSALSCVCSCVHVPRDTPMRIFAHTQWWKPFFPKGSHQWGPYAAGRTPVIDKWAGRPQGGLVDSIKNGRIKCVGSVVGSSHDSVNVCGLHGNAEWRHCDVIVLATGFDHTYAEWLPQVPSLLPPSPSCPLLTPCL